MNEKVSIVVLVYKTEQYIHKCIASIMNQTYKNIELVLVDDGSPDECPKICDEYAEKYANVKVVHKQNGGVGDTRNFGMDAASGDFLMFVDSDDMLDSKTAVEKLVEAARSTCADIVQGNFRKLVDEVPGEIKKHGLRAGEYTKTSDFRYKGFYRNGHLSYAWGKIYRMEFLKKHGIRSKLYRFTQDKPFNYMCYVNNCVYAFIDESVYLYRINTESVTFKRKNNYAEVWIQIATDFYEYTKTLNCENEVFDLSAFHILFGALFIAKQEYLFSIPRFAATKKALIEYASVEFVQKAMEALSSKTMYNGIEKSFLLTVYRIFSRMFAKKHFTLLTIGICGLVRFKLI